MLLFRSVALLVSTVAVAADKWRADLDWAAFEAQLSPETSLLDTDFTDFMDECLPEFRDKAYANRSNHALIDQPSGMCVDQLFCAYERCWPRPDASTSTQDQRVLDEGGFQLGPFDALPPETQNWFVDATNPSLNLPSKVLFPQVASDVVAAIQFAKANGLEISVKNSGHSFSGASTKKDTLHLNMNQYTGYAPTGIVDCPNVADTTRTTDLGDQPCRLAVARNKPAFIRVGGGENWDKVYRAVDAANLEQGNKYHAVGGAAGTVSPMGWTFQGGLAGTQGGRMYGFGVDQVLQVEMVLPNGQHVKFGPVEWEDASADGFIAPKTTLVAGVCRSNPEELEESLWEWTECSADINFDDLWFAVNGGGGGTWGVVTSIYLQLHDYLSPRVFGMWSPNAIVPIDLPLGDCDPAVVAAIFLFFEYFRLTWVFAPGTLNVSQAQSDACGMADPGQLALVCYGDGAYQALIDSWEGFATAVYDPAVYGVPLNDTLACPGTIEGTWSDIMKNADGPYAGRVTDLPRPTITSIAGPPGVLNVLYPMKYVQENFETLIMGGLLYQGPTLYLAFGSGTASASDQANSLSAAHRQGGYKIITEAADFYNTTFGALFDTSDKTNFPSFQGANHVGNNYMGPLKDDWTKACPTEWTQEERDQKCVSIQETLWGTKILKRLEGIKEAIDPDYMFDCTGCVGNNRVKKETEANTGTNSSAGSATTIFESNGGENSSGFSIVLPWQHPVLVLIVGALVLW